MASQWTGWTLTMVLRHDHSTLNIVVELLWLLLLLSHKNGSRKPKVWNGVIKCFFHQNMTWPLCCKKLLQRTAKYCSRNAEMLCHAGDKNMQSLRRHSLIKPWTLQETTKSFDKLYNNQKSTVNKWYLFIACSHRWHGRDKTRTRQNCLVLSCPC